MERARALPERIGLREVGGLAWPIMVSMLSTTAMSVVDTLFVGRLGTAALASVGLAAVMVHLVHAFGYGLISGGRVVVAQRTGAGQHLVATRLAGQLVWLAVGLGVIVAAMVPLGRPVFELMGASPQVGWQAEAYFSVRALGAPMLFVMLAGSAWFQGRGDTRTPMQATLIANVSNIVLDPLFIFGWGPVPGLGVAGAAMTTVFGLGLGAAFLLWRLRSTIRWGEARVQWALLAEIWRLGSPIGVRQVLDVASFALFAGLLARGGDAALAAHVLVIRIISVSFLPGHAVGEAAGVLVGQAVGADRPALARQAWASSLGLALAIMGVAGGVFLAVPGVLIAPFGAAPAVAVIARDLMRIGACFQIFDAVAMVALGALNGAGDTRVVMRLTVAAAWLVKLPVGWLLAVQLGMGAQGAWLGLTAEIVVVAALATWRIRDGGWLQARERARVSRARRVAAA